eukprot:CAMPEP_0195265264 /NCGR_PEP_ID=MMETSP0706-20130129/11320_1 /TAXON_ID=33640 /ORGANISM="Asterionellopsis glacialis, Strain CCMP134" /LENGTH=203 /DNA_ID=CAMNT_0040319649 /DNA_START=103 /DNA_END=714 /DNA_ORIENTATION=+
MSSSTSSFTTSVSLVVFGALASATIMTIRQQQQQTTKKKSTTTTTPHAGIVQAQLRKLGITLPIPPPPKGNYVSCTRQGNVLYICGHIPTDFESGKLLTGKVGQDLTVEEGYASAKACAINILGTLAVELNGNLDRIKRIVKVVGFVNCTDDFAQQPAVVNGASDLFGDVFGDKGKHARSAVGANSLPLNIATEVECIVEIED